MDRRQPERRASPWRRVCSGVARSSAARGRRLPRAEWDAARRDATRSTANSQLPTAYKNVGVHLPWELEVGRWSLIQSSPGQQTFRLVPIRRRIDAERVTAIDEQRAAVFAIDATGSF